jgi:ketosteroid isomerase-like protein
MKKLIFTIAALCIVLINSQVKGQNWTTQEKEIIKRVETGWSSWQDAVNQKDFSIWLKAANPTNDWTCWWLQDGALWNLDDEKRNFELFTKDVKKYYWIKVFPLSVKVHENVAFIWFYASFAIENKDGTTVNTEEKRFEVYQKIEGEWRWSAGMVTAKNL